MKDPSKKAGRFAIASACLLAGALLTASSAQGQVLTGPPGAPSTRAFPDSRVLPDPHAALQRQYPART